MLCPLAAIAGGSPHTFATAWTLDSSKVCSAVAGTRVPIPSTWIAAPLPGRIRFAVIPQKMRLRGRIRFAVSTHLQDLCRNVALHARDLGLVAVVVFTSNSKPDFPMMVSRTAKLCATGHVTRI